MGDVVACARACRLCEGSMGSRHPRAMLCASCRDTSKRQALRNRSKRYYSANAELCRARSREAVKRYYEKFPEKRAEVRKRGKEKNPDRYREVSRKGSERHRANNPESYRASQKRYGVKRSAAMKAIRDLGIQI